MKEKQDKRKKNIQAKKQGRLDKKFQKAKKKGRMVPGFQKFKTLEFDVNKHVSIVSNSLKLYLN